MAAVSRGSAAEKSGGQQAYLPIFFYINFLDASLTAHIVLAMQRQYTSSARQTPAHHGSAENKSESGCQPTGILGIAASSDVEKRRSEVNRQSSEYHETYSSRDSAICAADMSVERNASVSQGNSQNMKRQGTMNVSSASERLPENQTRVLPLEISKAMACNGARTVDGSKLKVSVTKK